MNDNQYNMGLFFKHILSNIQGVCRAQLKQGVPKTLVIVFSPHGFGIVRLDHDSLGQLANSPTGAKNDLKDRFSHL